MLEQAGGWGGGATCRDVTTGAKRRKERSGRSRSRGGGRCRFVEDEVRSDATPDRSRSRPECCGGIAFPRKLCAAGSLIAVPWTGSPLPSPGRSGRTFPGCSDHVSPAVTWLPASGSSRDSIRGMRERPAHACAETPLGDGSRASEAGPASSGPPLERRRSWCRGDLRCLQRDEEAAGLVMGRTIRGVSRQLWARAAPGSCSRRALSLLVSFLGRLFLEHEGELAAGGPLEPLRQRPDGGERGTTGLSLLRPPPTLRISRPRELHPTLSGRRSAGAGCRSGRRSYLPGRDDRSAAEGGAIRKVA